MESRAGGLVSLAKPLLRNDLVYDALVTRLADYVLTLRTVKATRIQLREVRAKLGTGVSRYSLPQGLQMEFDLSSDLDAFMLDYLMRFGHYEREVESALAESVRRETAFVDVGANVGYFTLLCSRLAAKVYAFEPVPAIFERLSRNIELNGLKNVKPFRSAVWRESGKLKIFESKISSGHDSTVKRFEHDRSFTVDCVTLDEVVDASAKEVVMKVDVEGAEMDVLLGAAGLMRSGRVSKIVVEWARGIYGHVTDLRERFSLYASLGKVEVLDDLRGRYEVKERTEVPEYCNLLITVNR